MIVATMLIGMEFTTLKLQIGLLHNTISQVDIMRRHRLGILRNASRNIVYGENKENYKLISIQN